MGIFEVNVAALIAGIAEDLKKQGIAKPAWATFVKTGAHRERAPDNVDWWHIRMASILYRVYKSGSVGTGGLRSYYGGRKRRGPKRAHFRKASGKIVRNCLQALETQGLIKKGKKGREITAKGQSYLNRMAKQVAEKAPMLERQKAEMKEKEKIETETERKVGEELRKIEAEQRKKEKGKEEKKEKKHEKKEEEKNE